VERIALKSGGFRREYLLVSSSQTGGPLLVFLHGAGATAQWADEESGWSTLAEREGFSLAIPEGLRKDLDRPPKFLDNPQRWNDGVAGVPFGQPRADDVSYLAAVIDDVLGRAAIDSRRVYVSGFSNGAAMTFRAATELAGRIAAIAPVAGYCWVDDPKPARPIPTLYAIGSLDPLVPVRGGEVRSPWRHRYVRRPPISDTLDRWAKAVGCVTPPRTESDDGRMRVDTYPGPVPFRVVTIDGLGHHWPGGKGRLNHRIAGPPLAAVNATELVWEFLRQQSL
jgi:polyhydroxybutyrate depolymerase